MYHGTLSMYHGIVSMYHGILSMYHGTLVVSVPWYIFLWVSIEILTRDSLNHKKILLQMGHTFCFYLNSFETGNIPVCGWRFDSADYITVHVVMKNYIFIDFLVF